jgi:hypothetical protein
VSDADRPGRLEWNLAPKIFPEIQAWGSTPLPEGGGYVVSWNAGLVPSGLPWHSTFKSVGGPTEDLGYFSTRERAEAACELHLRKHRQ